MTKTNQIITIDQMKGAIGSLVFLWSSIERTLTDSIRRMNDGEIPNSAHGISRSLEQWSRGVITEDGSRLIQTALCSRSVKMLKEALSIRNLVCHGLIGYSAQTHQNEPEAHLIVKLGNDERTLTWSELDEMFRWMSRISRLIENLTYAAMEEDTKQANDRLRAWEGFPKQK